MHDAPSRQLVALAAAIFATLGALQCAAEEETRDAAHESREVSARVALGEYLWDAGEESRALAEWKAAEQLDPKNPRVIEHLAEAATARGEVREAAALYARAVSLAPKNPALHFALANVCFLFRHELIEAAHPDAESRLREALAHFAEAARLAPANADYARAYAESFYAVASPDWQAAIEAWKHVEALTPGQNFSLTHLARVYLKMGHFDAAEDCLRRVQLPEGKAIKARLEEQIGAATRRQ
jgi:cytochrome c-type biogenesis protein CcmH/NrfG